MSSLWDGSDLTLRRLTAYVSPSPIGFHIKILDMPTDE